MSTPYIATPPDRRVHLQIGGSHRHVSDSRPRIAGYNSSVLVSSNQTLLMSYTRRRLMSYRP
eukprot:1836439-Rhodomonas_salina.1